MTKHVRDLETNKAEQTVYTRGYGGGALQFIQELSQIRDQVLVTDASKKPVSLEGGLHGAMERMVSWQGGEEN